MQVIMTKNTNALIFQIFCSCGNAENAFYVAYKDAEAGCAGQGSGSGYDSCLAVKLGFVSTLLWGSDQNVWRLISVATKKCAK